MRDVFLLCSPGSCNWRSTPSGLFTVGSTDSLCRWTDPSDGAKERFFRNDLGLILDRDPQGGILGDLSTLLQFFVVFNGRDNFPVFLGLPSIPGPIGRSVERGFTHTALNVVSVIGWFAGYRAEYPEYTPGL
jgi:hypothetical protein